MELCCVAEVGPGYNTFLVNSNDMIQSGPGIPLFSELYVLLWVTLKRTEYRAGMSVFLSFDPDG